MLLTAVRNQIKNANRSMKSSKELVLYGATHAFQNTSTPSRLQRLWFHMPFRIHPFSRDSKNSGFASRKYMYSMIFKLLHNSTQSFNTVYLCSEKTVWYRCYGSKYYANLNLLCNEHLFVERNLIVWQFRRLTTYFIWKVLYCTFRTICHPQKLNFEIIWHMQNEVIHKS